MKEIGSEKPRIRQVCLKIFHHLRSILNNFSFKKKNHFLAFVGFGSCLDIFTSASELFTAMNYTEFPEPKEFGVLNSQNEFLSEFGYYFQQGAAAERNKDLKIFIILNPRHTRFSGWIVAKHFNNPEKICF